MFEIVWIAVTAIGTWCLVGVTLWMTERHHKVALTNLRVRHEMLFVDRWESKAMRQARQILARQLLAKASDEEIQESVLDFWESVGCYWLHKYLLENLVWSDFGHCVVRWWPACKAYVEEQQRRNQNDQTIYLYFNKLAHRMLEIDARERDLEQPESLGSDDINRFLRGEAALECGNSN